MYEKDHTGSVALSKLVRLYTLTLGKTHCVVNHSHKSIIKTS